MSFINSKNSIIASLSKIDIHALDVQINNLAKQIVNNSNNSVLICGNGGSAAEAEHFVAELICKFEKVRKPISSMTLHPNIPTITAIGNDFDFEHIFTRNLEALGKKGDLLIAMSTSGNSKNVLNVLMKAKEMGINTFCLSGGLGGELNNLSNNIFLVESDKVSTIQEIHLIFLHSLCSKIDSLIE
jgi:D-sedoheptulose 7-phosphate isomerase